MQQKNVNFFTIGFLKILDLNLKNMFCNGCHYVLTTGYSLENLTNLGVKGAIYRCILMRTSKKEALEKLNNSVTRDRGVL